MVERISLMLRLERQPERLEGELRKLLNRLYKTNLTPQPDALRIVTGRALEAQPVDRITLLSSVEGLFCV